MSRLTQNTCVNLATKLGNTIANPPRLADLKAALYGKRGGITDEISYLGKNKSKLSDAWIAKARSVNEDKDNNLNDVRNTFMLSETF